MTARVQIAGKECRVVFQATKNRDASHLERLIDVMTKESPLGVMLPLSPFDLASNWIYREPEEIDTALFERYSGKKTFRVGAEARIVHERVSNLKRVSINQSLLYNFSSEGAFPELSIPVTLYEPLTQESIQLLVK